MAIKVGLNGFGRIGRHIFRAHWGNPDFEIVAINDLFPAEFLAYLLQYDSVYKKWDKKVGFDDKDLIVAGKKVHYSSIRNIEELPWGDLGVDVVIEATGVFTKYELFTKHLTRGPKKVVLTQPSKDKVDITVVMGCNDDKYDPKKHASISNASCTTNCFAPMVKVLKENFGIVNGLMTTIHAYTATQSLLDVAQKDMRRSRAAPLNSVPSTTGAAKAIKHIFPDMEGKLDAMSFRIPVPTVSSVDFVCNTEKPVTVDSVNAAFKAASEGKLKGYLGYSDEELVSSDFIGNEHSCIFDATVTTTIGDKMAKTIGWYDNEWGYSVRVVDLVKMIARKWA